MESAATAQPTVIFHDGRTSMRSLADAIEKLRELYGIDADSFSVRTSPLRLQTGELTAVVALLGPDRAKRHAVMLPSSARFYGVTTLGARVELGTHRLDEALVDLEGNVELADGTYLHAVELVPTPIRPELSEQQRRIVELAVIFVGAQDLCYRPIDPSLPDFFVFDYSVLPTLKLPSLKVLEGFITRDVPCGRQTIATALAVAGMRLPRSGRDTVRPTRST